MAKLLILATDESPQIMFDPSRGILDISGKSLPEDIHDFYSPLEQAVVEYIDNPQPETKISFDLVYLNSASTKRILEIISHFEKLHNLGDKVVFNWYYNQFDDDMRDEGEEFSRLTDLSIKIIEKSERV
ncbi:MAG: DUF1987 domain-containing protein [Bacteroidales bacterium]|nr:DUF1987 domain-containing protein [Bacteroidales bacterium]MDY0196331.1 DUF1987 domain-containing protein [Tenuifilaceae bacterium]